MEHREHGHLRHGASANEETPPRRNGFTSPILEVLLVNRLFYNHFKLNLQLHREKHATCLVNLIDVTSSLVSLSRCRRNPIARRGRTKACPTAEVHGPNTPRIIRQTNMD